MYDLTQSSISRQAGTNAGIDLPTNTVIRSKPTSDTVAIPFSRADFMGKLFTQENDTLVEKQALLSKMVILLHHET
ncbi:hypothetical protein P4S73_27540 [Paraglaciecola sp. Hal342]